MPVKRKNYQGINQLYYIWRGLKAVRDHLQEKQSLLTSNYASFGPDEDHPLDAEIRFLTQELIPCVEDLVKKEGGK